MSLALRLFFWDEAATTTTQDSGAGSGKASRRDRLYASDDFPQLDEDFWHVRENYLRAIHEKTAPEDLLPIVTLTPPSEVQPEISPLLSNYTLIPRFIAERSALIAALRLSKNLEELKANGARLIAINRAIEISQRLRASEIERKDLADAAVRSIRRQNKRKALRQAGSILLQVLKSAVRLRP